MKRALIQGTRICDVVDPGQEFEVAPDLLWVDVADDTTQQDTYENGTVVKFQPYVPTALEVWESEMKASDSIMTRIEEEIIDTLTPTAFSKLSQEVKDKHAAKKELRAGKP